MAKVKVNFKAAQSMQFLDEKMGKEMGLEVVSEMRRMIASGQSPVKGTGRFERYSEQKGGSYPKSVRERYPDKKTRPVNLSLNDWYLSHLTYWVNLTKQYVGIGFSGKGGVQQPPPQKVKDFFEAHNEGMNKNVPRRKHLPNAEGDRFAVSVERKYKAVAEKEISRIINEQNKKR